MDKSGVVIVGGNVAGLRVAESLRRSGYEEPIVLVGDEPYAPYDRPPLSKKFLEQADGALTPVEAADKHRLFLKKPTYFEDQRIDLRLNTRAESVDVASQTLTTDRGPINYDQLVIATGARARPLPGLSPLDGVFMVRTLDDALAIRSQIKSGRSALIVGAGVIGCEVAATLLEQGMDVTIVESGDVPLVRAFGPKVGAIYRDEHLRRGVKLKLGVHVAALRGSTRVQEAQLSDGTVVPCDMVVVGIGVVPNTEWLAGSAVELSPRGVLVNEYCETSVPGIYAVGDVTDYVDPRFQQRQHVESIDNAQNQAIHAAQAIVGNRQPYVATPFFWSDQYDLKLQSIGYVGDFDEAVVRGSVEDNKYAVFHLKAGKLAFMIAVNRMKEVAISKKLFNAGTHLSAANIADLDFDLAQLLQSSMAPAAIKEQPSG